VPILAREPASNFTPCPEGLHQAVCVDVVDLGVMVTQWGDKPKVRIVWQVDEIDPQTGRRFDVRGLYTLSLSDKATLRKQLESWRGRKFTPLELRGFDLENLIGVNCQIQVIHHISDDGRTFANVQAIVPCSPKIPKIAPLDFVRERDRAALAPIPGAAATPAPLDEVPF
jgi:hypothetical protein